jgi:hypothetical protein
VRVRVGSLTLVARPAALNSSNKGRICSASIKVETMILTGPVPAPTWSLVSSVVWKSQLTIVQHKFNRNWKKCEASWHPSIKNKDKFY